MSREYNVLTGNCRRKIRSAHQLADNWWASFLLKTGQKTANATLSLKPRDCSLVPFQVTWYIPETGPRRSHHRSSRLPRLTRVRRNQHFLSYLAAVRRTTVASAVSTSPHCDSLHQPCPVVDVLKVVSWSVDVRIDTDPSSPVGQRVVRVGPTRQRGGPRLLKPNEAPRLADNALGPPSANMAQTLVWWPGPTSSQSKGSCDDDDDGGSDGDDNATELQPTVIVAAVDSSEALRGGDLAKRTFLNSRSGHVDLLRTLVSELCSLDEKD